MIKKKSVWAIVILCIFTLIIPISRGVTIRKEIAQQIPQVSTEGSSERVLLNKTTWGFNNQGTGVSLNMTGIEITNETGMFYEIDYDVKIDKSIYGDEVSRPCALQFSWLDNITVNQYARFVNLSLPKGSQAFLSEKLTFNLTSSINFAGVKINFRGGGSSSYVAFGQYIELSDWGFFPILVSNPNHFEYWVNFYTSDGENVTIHQFANEVFWPNITDYFGLGTVTTTTIKEAPVNSTFENMELHFATLLYAEHAGGSTFQKTYSSPNETESAKFSWHTAIDDDYELEYNLEYYDDNYNTVKRFSHMFEVMIGNFDYWSGFDVWINFGQLQPDSNSIPGYWGLWIITLISTIAMINWIKRKSK